jgi:hypothetical protein
LVHGRQSDWLYCLLKLPLEHGQDLEVAEPVAQDGQARRWSRPRSEQPGQEQRGGHPDGKEDAQADADRYQDYPDGMPGSDEGVAAIVGIVGTWVNGAWTWSIIGLYSMRCPSSLGSSGLGTIDIAVAPEPARRQLGPPAEALSAST